MTPAALGKQIDALGALRDTIHALKDSEETLRAAVEKGLRRRPKPFREAAGRRYAAKLNETSHLTVGDMAALKKLAGRKFLRVIRADLAAAEKVLGREALEQIGGVETKTQVRVYALDPATAPRMGVKAGEKGRRKQ